MGSPCTDVGIMANDNRILLFLLLCLFYTLSAGSINFLCCQFESITRSDILQTDLVGNNRPSPDTVDLLAGKL